MKEHPILFSGPMVRAILAGKKTQTRRIMKPQPEGFHVGYRADSEYADLTPIRGNKLLRCPYGGIGDMLWVRETWQRITVDLGLGIHDYYYRATDKMSESYDKWSPSIFMPRSASRITLEITNILVERVRDISEDDAKAEGFPLSSTCPTSARDDFAALWRHINGAESWELNPWVRVIEFRRIKP